MATTWPDAPAATSLAYERFAATCAILAGLAGLGYALAFVVLKAAVARSTLLLLGGLLTAAALLGLFGRLRPVDPAFAGLALVLGLAGALGAAAHAGFDLANGLHPPAAAVADLPNAVDPRGLMTFGVAGLGLLVVGWLITRGTALPLGLGYLGYVTGVLLVLLYLARLIVLDPASPLVLGPALAGGLLAPAFYIWFGVALRRG